MTSTRSVNIKGRVTGSVIATGDHNEIHATAQISRTAAEAGANVDIAAVLSALRETLGALSTEDSGKIDRAIADAQSELEKTKPDKDEVGGAIERALKYAEKAADFAVLSAKLAPTLGSASLWLGANWQHLVRVLS